MAPQQSTRTDWDHPVFNALLGELRQVIMHGRGVVIVPGITPDRYSEDEFERIYWGFGLHLGVPTQEHLSGTRLAYVQQEGDENLTNRGYRSNAELSLHSDSYELMGLMCVRPALSGGESRMASTVTIHNEILRTRPDLLEPLYRGFPHWIWELSFTSRPATPERIPIFSYVDGKLSCLAGMSFIRQAAKNAGVKLPPEVEEAYRYFREVAERPDINMTFMLEPGEILLCHNFTNLHARNAFKNSDTRKRLLLRLHCDVVDEPRPVAPELLGRSNGYAWYWGGGWQEKQNLEARGMQTEVE